MFSRVSLERKCCSGSRRKIKEKMSEKAASLETGTVLLLVIGATIRITAVEHEVGAVTTISVAMASVVDEEEVGVMVVGAGVVEVASTTGLSTMLERNQMLHPRPTMLRSHMRNSHLCKSSTRLHSNLFNNNSSNTSSKCKPRTEVRTREVEAEAERENCNTSRPS